MGNPGARGLIVSQGIAWGNCSPFREVRQSLYSVCRAASCSSLEVSGGDVSVNEPVLAPLVSMVCVCHLGSQEFLIAMWRMHTC